MYGSELQALERMMMLIPNFIPRGSGVFVVKKLQCEKGDVICTKC